MLDSIAAVLDLIVAADCFAGFVVVAVAGPGPAAIAVAAAGFEVVAVDRIVGRTSSYFQTAVEC